MHNKNSANYHRFMNFEDFGGTFGPSKDQIFKLSQWMESHGLRGLEVPVGRTHVAFTGNAGQVSEAFHIEIHYYNVGGVKHYANDRDPQVPAEFAGMVQGFHRMNDFRPVPLYRSAGAANKDKTTGEWKKDPNYPRAPSAADLAQGQNAPGGPTANYTTGGSTVYYLLGPQDFYTVYDENPLLNNGINGTGQTIAVIEETLINNTDVNTFRSTFGLPTYTGAFTPGGGVSYIYPTSLGSVCATPITEKTNGEEGEADIDTQWSGVSAPLATIDYLACGETSPSLGIDEAASYIINDLAPGDAAAGGAPVTSMSLSYGSREPEYEGAGTGNDPYWNSLWTEVAAQGQTAIVSSDDGGAEQCYQNDNIYNGATKGAKETNTGTYNVSVTDGGEPRGGLIQATDGNFYGATEGGGANTNILRTAYEFSACGTVFKITSSGALTTLHNFDHTDGANPEGGLVQGTDGSFYGTTNHGGANAHCEDGTWGTLFSITPGGTLTTLHSFDGTDGSGPAAALVQGTDGQFYGTTPVGGANGGGFGDGTIFSLSVGLKPFVETVPTSGTAGTAVNILGTNLTGATSVTFNGTEATFTVVSKSLITATVPAGTTTGRVEVVRPNGKVLSNVPFTVLP
jgi:uncharacterized repeat protein (TIGR03803 family)